MKREGLERRHRVQLRRGNREIKRNSFFKARYYPDCIFKRDCPLRTSLFSPSSVVLKPTTVVSLGLTLTLRLYVSPTLFSFLWNSERLRQRDSIDTFPLTLLFLYNPDVKYPTFLRNCFASMNSGYKRCLKEEKRDIFVVISWGIRL